MSSGSGLAQERLGLMRGSGFEYIPELIVIIAGQPHYSNGI